MIVRCTVRLLKLLSSPPVADLPPTPNDWYANLVWIDRRKCLLLVHADTLFPVFLADVRKPQLAHFQQLVADSIASALADERLAPDCLGPLEPGQGRIARTASRSILGFMNDMAAMSSYAAERAGGITALDTLDLNATLRRTLYNRDGYVRPIEAARQRCGQ